MFQCVQEPTWYYTLLLRLLGMSWAGLRCWEGSLIRVKAGGKVRTQPEPGRF